MLYYILPPIIIILGFSTLIFFLFRKVSKLPEGAIVIEEKPFIQWGKFREFFLLLGSFGLKILERLMQKTKLFSLKFHNTSNEWFHSIKKKREEHRMNLEKQKEAMKEEMEKIKESKYLKEKEEKFMPKNSPETEDFFPQMQNHSQEEIPVILRKPRDRAENFQMVSEKVTKPEKKAVVTKVKNKLEDTLIKRIAINPRDIEAYERLGDYYIEQDNLPDALECYRQVLRLSPVHHKAKIKISKIERVISRKI